MSYLSPTGKQPTYKKDNRHSLTSAGDMGAGCAENVLWIMLGGNA